MFNTRDFIRPATLYRAVLGLVFSGTVAAGEADLALHGAQPHLATLSDESALLSWLAPAGEGVALKVTRFDGERWSTPKAINAGDDWLVNWADFPSVTPVSNQVWAAHWLVRKHGGTYAYDVHAAISADAGTTWSKPFVVHDDDSPTEHGFATLFPWAGDLGVLWLDGRFTQGGQGHGADAAHQAGMTLRSARLDAAGTAKSRIEVDNLVCDCCGTDVAIAASGPVAVYRDRTNTEVRDIAIARMVENQWQPGQIVAADDWEIAGCPVNGPAVDAAGAHVAVAWFTASEASPRVQVAMSANNGRSFGTPTVLDDNKPAGRVDVVQLNNGDAVISWLTPGGDGLLALKARRLRADGGLGESHHIASTGMGRSSGFPQMIRVGDTLLFAWTDTTSDTPLVRTQQVPLAALR